MPYPCVQEKLNPYLAAYSELIDCVRNGRESSISSAMDGRAALEIIMAIYESKRHGIAPVHLPLPGAPSSLVRAIEESAF